MKIPTLVKLPNNKRFNFEPRYYDPVKEDLQNRMKLLDTSNPSKIEGIKNRIAYSFQKGNRSNKSAGTMRLVIFGILVLMFALIFFGNKSNLLF